MNRYQNGAYWHTPTGWLIAVLERRDPQLASKVLSDYIDYLRQNDFRLGSGHHAPWNALLRMVIPKRVSYDFINRAVVGIARQTLASNSSSCLLDPG